MTPLIAHYCQQDKLKALISWSVCRRIWREGRKAFSCIISPPLCDVIMREDCLATHTAA